MGTAIKCDGGDWQEEVYWSITACDGTTIVLGVAPYIGCVVLPDNYVINMYNSYEYGWSGNALTIGDDSSYTFDSGNQALAIVGECTEDYCIGFYDDCGVCNGPGFVYECGCSDIPQGNCDCDGNVLDECGVCDANWSLDTDGDGICDADEVLGCNDPSACNYDPTVSEDGGSCTYLEQLSSNLPESILFLWRLYYDRYYRPRI